MGLKDAHNFKWVYRSGFKKGLYMKLKHFLRESSQSDIQKLKGQSDLQKVYDELIDMLRDKKYDDSMDFMQDLVKDPKLKFILSLGFGGELADVKLKLERIVIPVFKLLPSQSEIGFGETLKYTCSGKNLEACFSTPAIIKKPIVTFQRTFIVDGHHRWSEIYVSNPQAKVECINIEGNLSPISMLKAVQATIASNTGTLIRKDIEGENLYDASEGAIKNYIKNHVDMEKLQKFYNDPVEELTKNCLKLKINNPPILGAPQRGDMPQTSKDPELFKDLKKGVTDI